MSAWAATMTLGGEVTMFADVDPASPTYGAAITPGQRWRMNATGLDHTVTAIGVSSADWVCLALAERGATPYVCYNPDEVVCYFTFIPEEEP